MAKLNFEIVTADGIMSTEEVDVVVANGVMGQLAILPSHAPLVTRLEIGEFMTRVGSEETWRCVGTGFMEVSNNTVTVLADTSECSIDIDVDRAEAARKRAQDRLASGEPDLDTTRVEASLRRALVRLRIASRS
jgi:F-type H+-transporting ATPase subunit epsilon